MLKFRYKVTIAEKYHAYFDDGVLLDRFFADQITFGLDFSLIKIEVEKLDAQS